MTGPMMNNDRMSAKPAMTWLGGTVCVPRALRVSDSTMKTRVKPVMRIRIAGAMASTVITMMMSTAVDGLFNPLTFTLTLDEAASNEAVMETSEAQGGVRAVPGRAAQRRTVISRRRSRKASHALGV